MKNYAVIDLGFGDTGKGLVTSYLASKNQDACVARFSGGPQATHKVMLDEERQFIFSNLGSGTLQGNPTHILDTCLVDPISMVEEIIELVENKNIFPSITIDGNCKVMTPFDMYANRNNQTYLKNGTCGRGIGTTIQREEDHYSLRFEDLYNKTVLKIKLDLIGNYYGPFNEGHNYIDLFLDSCERLAELKKQKHINSNIIFEGSQGLLLDQDIGFFPHVTRGNTSTKNIVKYEPEIYLVTRAYQTRHGNGPMTNKNIPHNIKLSKYEHNKQNAFQGEFNISILDLDLLKYAASKDKYIKNNKKNLVITCLDNIEEYFYTNDGKLKYAKNETEYVETIIKELNIDGEVLLSRTPFTGKIEKFK